MDQKSSVLPATPSRLTAGEFAPKKSTPTGSSTKKPTPRSRALRKKPVQRAIADNQVLAVLKTGVTIKFCKGCCSGDVKKCEDKSCVARKGGKRTPVKPSKKPIGSSKNLLVAKSAAAKISTPSPNKAKDNNNAVPQLHGKGAIPKKSQQVVKKTPTKKDANLKASDAATSVAVKKTPTKKDFTLKVSKAKSVKKSPSKKVTFEEGKNEKKSTSSKRKSKILQEVKVSVPNDFFELLLEDSSKKLRRGDESDAGSVSDSFETEEEHEIDEEIQREGLVELAAIQDKLLRNPKPKREVKVPKPVDELTDGKKLVKASKNDVKVMKAIGKMSKYVDKYLQGGEEEDFASDDESSSGSTTLTYGSCSECSECESDTSYDCFHETSSSDEYEEFVTVENR